MINVGSFYDKLLTITRKDVRGRSLSEDEFNELARVVSYELFEYFYGEFEKTGKITDSLSPFIVTNESLTISSNKASLEGLANTYKHLIGNPRYSTDTVVDRVTLQEYSDRFGDALTAPSTANPVCYVADNSGVLSLYVYPQITPVLVDYLKEPDEPFIDYYINDTTYVVTRLTEGQGAVVIPSGSTYRDGTAGNGVDTKTSATKDFDFNEEDEPLLMDMFLNKLGLQLRDGDMINYSNAEQQKQMSND